MIWPCPLDGSLHFLPPLRLQPTATVRTLIISLTYHYRHCYHKKSLLNRILGLIRDRSTASGEVRQPSTIVHRDYRVLKDSVYMYTSFDECAYIESEIHTGESPYHGSLLYKALISQLSPLLSWGLWGLCPPLFVARIYLDFLLYSTGSRVASNKCMTLSISVREFEW